LSLIVDKAVALVKKRLLDFGIDDNFIVRIKPRSKVRSDWVAMYRGGTQFRSNRPIFWVPEDFEETAKREVPDEKPVALLATTLFHEYGHVIEEWARMAVYPGYGLGPEQAEEAAGLIRANWGDVEDYAEDFARFVEGWGLGDDEIHKKIIALYRAAVMEP
jgi:hypothetical protein